MSNNLSQFKTVLRGYDPGQVEAVVDELSTALEAARREAADRTVELSKAQSAHAELIGQLDAATSRIGQLEEAQRTAASPTYRDLGERIASILSLADEEAQAVRGVAALEAQQHRDGAATAVAALRAESERYAEDVRTKAEADAARIVEEAKKSADTMLDHADRESAARREEAEALFESQRARAASAAADFETTLADRRDKAAAEFATLLSTHEEALSSVQSRASQLAHESDAAHQEARNAATATIQSANEEAALLVQQAREQADRIRRDSERELAAATARRDSINAQLTNVRQMLATLGGTALTAHVIDQAEEHGEVPASDSDHADVQGEEGTVALDADASEETEAEASEADEPEADEPEADETSHRGDDRLHLDTDLDDDAEGAETANAR